jgi:zinc D-Ala-D-Ala carboxypeptidase
MGEDCARIRALHAALGIPDDYVRRSGLPRIAEAAETVVVGPRRPPREHRLAPVAAAAWCALEAAAEGDGIRLLFLSGFRTYGYQADLIRRKIDRGSTLEQALTVIAAPGHSEHHSGHAVDIGTPGCEPLSEAFEGTSAFAWLQRNGGRFGFHMSYPRGNGYGIIYEPWHWALAPVPTAD